MDTQRGVSLAEALVAITVLALAMTVALVLHNGARRSFKVGENLAEQQQVVRIAFDKLSRDLGMTGFNQNPDGTKMRPDEAIEAAYDTAVVIRADFDARDPARSSTPETALAAVGGAFPSVSVGNDEIVGYVLAKPDLSSPNTLDFTADVVSVPRDGVVEPVSVGGVALVQDDPPYTLYRITIDDNAATARRVPLVDNVRRLLFTYHDASGVVVAAPGGGEDDTSRNRRARIRRIGIEIEGLTRDRDARWRDRGDSDPDTWDYRKFRLSGDVTPPNLGLYGLKDLEASISPPSQPPPPVLYPGHCGGLYIEWSPNPPQDEVARYEVRYGTDPAALGGPEYAGAARHYLNGLNDATQYHVTIEAVDDSGNVSAPSAAGSATTANLNEPEQPVNLVVTTGEENVVPLTWDPVVDNVTPTAPGADPLYPQMRDFDRYNLYRDDERVAEQRATSFNDEQVVNCKSYYYKVAATDDCGLEGAQTPPVEGHAYTTVSPEAPLNLQAYVVKGGARLVWDAPTRNVGGVPIYIEDYKLFRATLGGLVFWSSLDFVSGATEYVDATYTGKTAVAYKVQAYDSCPNYSADSNVAEPTCTFVETVTIQQPLPRANPEPGDPIQVGLTGGGSGTYDLTLRFLELPSELEFAQDSPSTGPPWSSSWPVGAAADGLYRIDATVRRDDGCELTTSRIVEDSSGGGG